MYLAAAGAAAAAAGAGLHEILAFQQIELGSSCNILGRGVL
jgi:hypothetical protein